MVGKKSGKALLRDEGKPDYGGKMGFLRVERTNGKPAGLERTDNNMDLSSWPVVAPINQKNYYTYAASLLLPCHGNAPLLTLPDQ
jgi:actin-related protein 8